MPDLKHPLDWEIKDIASVGAAVSAVAAWLWRRAIKDSMFWILNAVKAPARIETLMGIMAQLQDEVSVCSHRSRVIYRMVDYPCWESDASGLCIFANRPMLNLLQCQFSDLAGDNWKSIIYPEDRELVFEEWNSCVRDHRDFNLSYRWLGTGGDVIDVEVTTSRLLDHGGDVAGYIAFVNPRMFHHRQADFKKSARQHAAAIIMILSALICTGCATPGPTRITYHRDAKEVFSVEIPQQQPSIITTIGSLFGSLGSMITF